ncbi:MAG: hypothetical protein M1826_005543 [Phylliscum demangeonii]|nr:MAG: hypothetical protein M1826_005543 [Phylliscum demangeonii]
MADTNDKRASADLSNINAPSSDRRSSGSDRTTLPKPVALQLPDILLKVLEYLADDVPSLLSAILVDKTWAEEGTNVLWRKRPVDHLAAIPDSRRQLYAGKIYTLSFAGDDESAYHEVFRHLRFPRLKRLTVDAYRPRNHGKLWIGQYLQPSLESFEFYGGDLAEELLDVLALQCPRLRKITIDNPGDRLDPERFLQFLKNRKSLVSLDFVAGMDHLVTKDMLCYLASRDNLERLVLGKLFGLADIEAAFEGNPTPFKHLRDLRLRLESNAVPALVSAVRSVTELSLEIEDDRCRVLPAIASMKDLCSLEVMFRQNEALPSAEIATLQALTQLRKLILQPWVPGEKTLQALTLTDEDFIQLVTKLPHLRRLTFQAQCNLSVAVLHALSASCPSLACCELLGSYELQALDAERVPLFPNLRLLDLGSAQADEHEETESERRSRAQQVAELLRRQAPVLEELYLVNGDDFSEEMMTAFEKLARGVE